MDIIELNKIVMRIRKGEVYYFNKKGVYCKIPLEKALKTNRFYNLDIRDDGSYFWNTWAPELMIYNFSEEELPNNDTLRKKVVALLKVGDTIEDYKRLMKTVKIEKHPKPEGLDRFLGKISTPVYVREPENPNKNTFDYIYVDVCFVRAATEGEDIKEYVNRNFKFIKEKVLTKLKNSRSFTKYGVPVNFLTITRATIRKDDVIQMVFRLKDIQSSAS